MPNLIRLFNAVSYREPRQPPSLTLCTGSSPLGSGPITSPRCGVASLTSSGLFAFRQEFSNIRIFDPSNFAMAMFVATTAVDFPGELRGQLSHIYQDMTHTGPPPIPQPPPATPHSTQSIVSTTVPLNFGQQNAEWSRVYSATPVDTGACIITASGATFTLTLRQPTSSIVFSDIAITRLNSALTAVHIHGPCNRTSDNNDGAACNAGVLFTICGPPSNRPCPLTNAIGALTIPGFTVDAFTVQTFSLFQNMATGLRLFYVNFHTNA
jgi:hypothetical protein